MIYMSLIINNIDKIIREAETLAGMGIKIAELARDEDRGVYVGKIPSKGHVTPHYHPDLDGGTEWYQIVEAGEDAFMHTGRPKLLQDNNPGSSGESVDWDEPVRIMTHDFFIIPNGTVHSLVAGEQRLRFIFGCPDAHLQEGVDKIALGTSRT